MYAPELIWVQALLQLLYAGADIVFSVTGHDGVVFLVCLKVDHALHGDQFGDVVQSGAQPLQVTWARLIYFSQQRCQSVTVSLGGFTFFETLNGLLQAPVFDGFYQVIDGGLFECLQGIFILGGDKDDLYACG